MSKTLLRVHLHLGLENEIHKKSKDQTVTKQFDENKTSVADVTEKVVAVIRRKNLLTPDEFKSAQFYLTLPKQEEELKGDDKLDIILQKQTMVDKAKVLWVRRKKNKKSTSESESASTLPKQEEEVKGDDKLDKILQKQTMVDETKTSPAITTKTIKVEEMTNNDVKDWFLSFKDDRMDFWSDKILPRNMPDHGGGAYLKKFDEFDFKEHDAVEPFKENFLQDLAQLKENGYKKKI